MHTMKPQKEDKARRALVRLVHNLGGSLSDETDDYRDKRDPVERLIASETSPMITHRDWLERHGVTFPAPGTIQPEHLGAELKRLIAALAFARVFLDRTDHLSDTQLYDRLHAEVLEGEEPDIARMGNECFHWSLSEENKLHSKVWLAYYADAEQRAEYAALFPKRAMPPKRSKPFHRDATLTKPFRD